MILRSFLFFIVSVAFAADGWNNFSRTENFYAGAVANGTLILATDGGVRFIYSNGFSEVYSSEDGLESSIIYGVVHAANGEILTVSDKGLIATYEGNGRFITVNRSYASNGTELVQGLAVTSDSILVLGFRDKISFFDYVSRKSVMTLSRIGDVSLKALSPSAMLVQGDSLFVALGSELASSRARYFTCRSGFLDFGRFV